jgi:MGT family glycosyltransferase
LIYTTTGIGHVDCLVSTAQELVRRGHDVTVATYAEAAGMLGAEGIQTRAIDPEIERLETDDYLARTPIGATSRSYAWLLARAPLEIDDLHRMIEELRPDALLIDLLCFGAAAAAQGSGLPWGFYSSILLPLPSKHAPPQGLGLAPLGGVLGRVRDTVLGFVVDTYLERAHLPAMNKVRASTGARPIRSLSDYVDGADTVICYTAEPFEYHRPDWPQKVHLVGPSIWEKTADPPPWLDELKRPIVLVTGSTVFQDDGKFLATAVSALANEPYDVIVTAPSIDRDTLPSSPNARIEPFVPHGPVLDKAAAFVSHAGMGGVTKALTRGVPVLAVPFGRDQPEVARRLEVAKAGVRLMPTRLNEDRLRSALAETIGRREGAQRIAAAFGACDPAVAASDALEKLPAASGVGSR